MRVTVKNKDIFPLEVRELLRALDSAGFFEESMLIGSWVMPLYQEVFSINYILRTLDIDFAVKFIHQDSVQRANIFEHQKPRLFKTAITRLS
jgi:hypothetical protein